MSAALIPLPEYTTKESRFNQREVKKYRAILAFMLRSWGLSRLQVAQVLDLKPKAGDVAKRNAVRSLAGRGRNEIIACGIYTVIP